MRTAAKIVVVALVLVLLAVMVAEVRKCSARGGVAVRGVFGIECAAGVQP